MMDFYKWYKNVAARHKYRWEFMRRSGLFQEHCQTVLEYNECQRLIKSRLATYTNADQEIYQVWNLPTIPTPLDHTRLYHLPTFKELLNGWMVDLENSKEPASAVINGKAPDHRALLLDLARKMNDPGTHAQPLIKGYGPFKNDNSIALHICSPIPVEMQMFQVLLEENNPMMSVAEIKGEDSGHFLYIRLNIPGLPMVPGDDEETFNVKATNKIAPLINAVEVALTYRKLVNNPVSIFGQRKNFKHLDNQVKALEGLEASDNFHRNLKQAQEKILKLEQAAVARMKLLAS